MHVSIRLFARLRELAGRDELSLDVTPGATISDVWAALTAEMPALEPYGQTVSAAVNDEYAPMRRPVEEGDEVAFLPPVSGGAP
jgi:molybdopterin converting factor subunit 1